MGTPQNSLIGYYGYYGSQIKYLLTQPIGSNKRNKLTSLHPTYTNISCKAKECRQSD
jgi:hypothetical protein